MGNADFSDSEFMGDANFNASKFSGNANFSHNKFTGDVNFSESEFTNNANFNKGIHLAHCVFRQRLKLHNTRFHDEISLEGAQVAFLHDAHFWQIPKLENCSFQNSFLLSLSLAGKELINCDFTGAVFDAVHTRDWKPDARTIENTRYIYTDHIVEIVESVIDEKGHEHRQYRPDPDSRIPATGEFAAGEQAAFTIKEYLKDPHKWNWSIKE